MSSSFFQSTASASAGAGFNILFDTFLKAILNVSKKNNIYESTFTRLEKTLLAMAPAINKIDVYNMDFDRPDEINGLKAILKKGAELVLKCSKIKRYDIIRKPMYASKLIKLEEKLRRYNTTVLQVHQVADQKEILFEVKQLGNQVRQMSMGPATYGFSLSGFSPPMPKVVPVGLEIPLRELKKKVITDGLPLLVLSASGGCGKTTLAISFCHDPEVKVRFKENIIFITVSKAASILTIGQNIFQRLGRRVPSFQSEEDAVNQLECLLKDMNDEPTLLVLDDVWSGADFLLRWLSFKITNYQILVTSRDEFKSFGSTYKLQTLSDTDAMNLFRMSAFPTDGPSYERDEEVQEKTESQMVKGCKGFPLSLKIVGRSLCGEPVEIWKKREMEISKVGSIFEYSDLLYCLQRSLDALDSNPTVKECFKDLASFPEDHLIPATALIDMWAEMYKLDDTGLQAISNLHELCTRNLADIVVTRPNRADANSYSQQFVTQHDLLRELAIHQTNLGTFEQRERLILEVTGNDVPDWWMEQKQLRIDSRLMSIATDERFSRTWCNIQAPKLEVLVLNCHTKSYTLPEFITGLDKLKTLIIMNHGILPAEVPNFQLLGRLSNLRKIRLERISVPLSGFTSVQFRKLEKITLVLCHIGQAFSPSSTIVVSEALPKLIEINIDYCKDLVEFPSGIGQLTELKRLRITNCHNLATLPREIGKLVNLEDLRLSSCIELAELPDTIGNLQNLSILDISECVDIRRLPQQIRELQNLRKLKMMGCSTGFELPESIFSLEHLEEVECDEETEGVWEPFACVLGNLKIKVNKEDINLNWLNGGRF
ncbi:Probable disease resistance protein At5g66900 [Linum perenne]